MPSSDLVFLIQVTIVFQLSWQFCYISRSFKF